MFVRCREFSGFDETDFAMAHHILGSLVICFLLIVDHSPYLIPIRATIPILWDPPPVFHVKTELIPNIRSHKSV